jgi:hypothetical protein
MSDTHPDRSAASSSSAGLGLSSVDSGLALSTGTRVSSSDVKRGQVEPTAALIATVAVCLSLGLYAVALGNAIPASERNPAEPTLDRVDARLSAGGVVVPARRGSALAAGPSGYRTNVTITAADGRWTAGPSAPADADRATQQTSVRVDADRVRIGTLQVAVWS